MYQRTIPEGEGYVLEDLRPNTVYNLWLAAKSQRGEGASTAPISVRTDQHSELVGGGLVLCEKGKNESNVCYIIKYSRILIRVPKFLTFPPLSPRRPSQRDPRLLRGLPDHRGRMGAAPGGDAARGDHLLQAVLRQQLQEQFR